MSIEPGQNLIREIAGMAETTADARVGQSTNCHPTLFFQHSSDLTFDALGLPDDTHHSIASRRRWN